MLLKQDEQFIDQIRKNYLALKSNQGQLGKYQTTMVERFIDLAEAREVKKIPFRDDQIDTGNSTSVFGAGESVDICNQFTVVVQSIVRGKVSASQAWRALSVWNEYMLGDEAYARKFAPSREFIKGMGLNLLIKKSEMLTQDSTVKIWTDKSKKIMEFANNLIRLYGPKYGLDSSWFSDDYEFNYQIDSYNLQKQEIREIAEVYQNENLKHQNQNLTAEQR